VVGLQVLLLLVKKVKIKSKLISYSRLKGHRDIKGRLSVHNPLKDKHNQREMAILFKTN
jgi:hypothetical protein